MRERLTTLLLALGALLLFVTLFVHGTRPQRERTAAPTSVERAPDGMYAAQRWLSDSGIRVISLRERFDTLARRRDLPASGNLLIATAPVVTPFRHSEAAALTQWLRAGNTLLLLAAVSDRPLWAAGGSVHNDVSLLTGLEFTARTPQQAGRRPGAATPDANQQVKDAGAGALAGTVALAQPLRSALVPNGPYPYLQQVGSAVALSDLKPQAWELLLPQGGFALALAHERERAQGVLWLRAAGAGTIVLSAFGSLFTNRAVGLADNARLLANLVAGSVAPAGAVLFDDEHQGLTTAYDPERFYGDARLYETLGVIAAVWLAWVLGGTRLRVPVMDSAAPREVELVRTSGLFLARVLRPAAAARRMFEHFFGRLQARARGLARGAEAPWDWLENHPQLLPADLAQLRAWHAAAMAGRRVPLMRLHNLIVRTERQLV